VHRFLDELLERIQEAEKRAAILDAMGSDDEDEYGLDDEEEEAMLRVEIPDWRAHFRNFEWRVRAWNGGRGDWVVMLWWWG
jgi:hypothetical protein